MLLSFRVHTVTWAPCYVFVPFCCANYAPVQSPSVFAILREYVFRHFPGGEGASCSSVELGEGLEIVVSQVAFTL